MDWPRCWTTNGLPDLEVQVQYPSCWLGSCAAHSMFLVGRLLSLRRAPFPQRAVPSHNQVRPDAYSRSLWQALQVTQASSQQNFKLNSSPAACQLCYSCYGSARCLYGTMSILTTVIVNQGPCPSTSFQLWTRPCLADSIGAHRAYGPAPLERPGSKLLDHGLLI